MKVDKIFINTFKYDFHLAKICLASVRYWYPDIPIFLIKDENPGKFRTGSTEKTWNVKVLQIERKKFGWGYGKLETLFLEPSFSYLVLDADTVMAGPVLDIAEKFDTDFIVDDEVQPEKRFNEIYYNLKMINQLAPGFVYPGYSFNSGQWFGTTGKISRKDFESTLDWSNPPVCRYPDIVFKGDQAHLNFVVHKLQQENKISVSRTRIMVWPDGENAEHIDLKKIKSRSNEYPVVIHWAGMNSDIENLNRADILKFFRKVYYTRFGYAKFIADFIKQKYLRVERKINYKLISR